MSNNTAKKIGPGLVMKRAEQSDAFGGAEVTSEGLKGPHGMMNTGSLSDIDMLKAQIAKLQEENQKLAQSKTRNSTLTCKVSQSGAVSVYGLGRFPVTLYAEQWAKLQGFMPTIEAFIGENDGKTVTVDVKENGKVVSQKTFVFSKARTDK